MKCQSEPTVVAYVAAPHNGYLQFFRKYAGGMLYVLGDDFIQEFTSLTRHLPGNTPEDAAMMIRALGIFSEVRILNYSDVENLPEKIVMPDEDIARVLAETRFRGRTVVFDGSWRLRWDLNATTHHREPEGAILVTYEALDQELMRKTLAVAAQSPDWWRQVGALLSKDGEPLFAAFNKHYPAEQTAYLCGDPRSNFGPGECIDATLALHGEIAVLTEAARRGIGTEGCDLYVSTFPCPPCANAVANSGIRRLYFLEGYSLVAGAETLRSRGVELFRVSK